MSGVRTKGHEHPHPHSFDWSQDRLNPLPEGEETPLPFKGRERVGMGFSSERLLIIGLGNQLMGDDGAGIEIVNKLKGLHLPEHVDVIDGGTPGVGLIDLMSGYSKVIVVDAVRGEDGTSSDEIFIRHVVKADENTLSLMERDRVRVGEDPNSDDNCSLHEMELTSVLKLMQSLEMSIPEITIVGIPAFSIAPGIGLSEECMKLIPQAVKLITELQHIPSPLTGEG